MERQRIDAEGGCKPSNLFDDVLPEELRKN
jgi:hypothetical protein